MKNSFRSRSLQTILYKVSQLRIDYQKWQTDQTKFRPSNADRTEPNRRRFLQLNRQTNVCELAQGTKAPLSRRTTRATEAKNSNLATRRFVREAAVSCSACCNQNPSGREKSPFTCHGRSKQRKRNERKEYSPKALQLVAPRSCCSLAVLVVSLDMYLRIIVAARENQETDTRAESSSVHTVSRARSVSSIFLRIVQRDTTHYGGSSTTRVSTRGTKARSSVLAIEKKKRKKRISLCSFVSFYDLLHMLSSTRRGIPFHACYNNKLL
ncbi:hypothetical protein K0M31_016997 [Melipona bicolor]|uniref:Uncharacterized protein n=1 Tax=Melipona bicolor TaxID=60889 RepID=A0AA40KE71_9HYME|nr:hypothetical protein K0M31_016997 [Melipona bicolor]